MQRAGANDSFMVCCWCENNQPKWCQRATRLGNELNATTTPVTAIVWNARQSEDDEGGVELVALEAELEGEVEDVGVGDVDAVWRFVRRGDSSEGRELSEGGGSGEGTVPRKASRYMMQRQGMTRKSILRMSLLSVVLLGAHGHGRLAVRGAIVGGDLVLRV